MGQIFALALISGLPFLLLHDLADEIRNCNQTKRERRASSGDKLFRERLFLTGYMNGIRKHRHMMRYCCIMNRILLLYFSVQTVLLPLCILCPSIKPYVKAALIGKAVILDVQIFIFALLNSRHQSNGGVGWRL
ncbi:MAG: hypothetical protein IK130_12380 [Oscillospiraceae bacterium]|nr:hypothetical protein [Oscillospiraceae bacterium]